MEIKLRHSGRLDPNTLERLVTAETEIHGDSGWRCWEVPIFAEYGRNYIFETDNGFIGSAQLIRDWDNPETVYLAGFGLEPARQGHGLGTRCLALLLDDLAAEDVRAVELTVAPDNDAAMKIYAGAGFKVVDRHDAKYGPGEDRLIMRVDIKGKQ